MQSEEFAHQTQEAVSALSDIFKGALLGVYLHGSAAQSRLRPQSDPKAELHSPEMEVSLGAAKQTFALQATPSHQLP